MFSSINFNTIFYLLSSMAVFLIAGSIHEYAHALSAKVQGDLTAENNGRLTINPLAHIDLFGSILFPLFGSFSGLPVIGWMKPVPVNPLNFQRPSRGFAITSFAGPFSNFLQASLAVILLKAYYLIINVFQLSGFNHHIFILFFQTYIMININLMIFNLLPFPPLDGGWILQHFIPTKYKYVFERIYPYGIFILYGLMLLGVLNYILNPVRNLFYTIFNLLPGTNFLITIIPFALGLAVVFIFLSNDILRYYKRKKFQLKVAAGIEQAKKSSQQTSQKNKNILLEAKKAVAKMEKKQPLDEKELKIIQEINEKPNTNQNPICEEYDFDMYEEDCIDCDNFITCLKRKISQLNE